MQIRPSRICIKIPEPLDGRENHTHAIAGRPLRFPRVYQGRGIAVTPSDIFGRYRRWDNRVESSNASTGLEGEMFYSHFAVVEIYVGRTRPTGADPLVRAI